MCSDGNGAVGCGAQEEFRACSDVAIGKGAASAIPTIKPPTKQKPSVSTTEKWPSDEDNEIDHHDDHDSDATNETSETQKPSNFYGAIIAVFTFFLVLCALAAIYIYFYHGDVLKSVLRRHQQQQKAPLSTNNNSTPVGSISSSLEVASPVRPPRTKRLSQNLKDINPACILIDNEKNNSDV